MTVFVKRLCEDALFLLAKFVGMCTKWLSRSNSVIFSQTQRHEYSGNSRYFYEFINDSADLDVKWLVSKSRVGSLTGPNFVARNSFSGIWCLIRSKYVVVSHGIGDFGVLKGIASERIVLVVWHGTPIKNIGLYDPFLAKSQSKIRRLLRETKTWDFFFVNSEIEKHYISSAFALYPEKVFVTGSPRNDILLRAPELGIEASNKIPVLLYAPTFRDDASEGAFFPFPDVCYEHLAEMFLKVGVRVHLRPHPNDMLSKLQANELAKRFPSTFIFDPSNTFIDQILLSSVALITDFSSIYFDALLIKKPVILVSGDIFNYSNSRGLAYPWEFVSAGLSAGTLSDFCVLLKQVLTRSDSEAKYDYLRNAFFEHVDDSSSRRIAQLLERDS
ncbi:CDP-glycerol glycerophosphotransferase family protein [Marinobacter salarius]|uniref:CDP-glycerol glycerophosphotransferase family protein n=1 Tax=Marinobacter salarius TaxID=1420917 RepID=UPI002943887C|nr:CDP-glycerol glycerophosphotransferase family protein [Marinobacter salarius]WOI21260.1 CDP-glycerol glycerophosphotransferase family protein [Marinobacter salarius]